MKVPLCPHFTEGAKSQHGYVPCSSSMNPSLWPGLETVHIALSEEESEPQGPTGCTCLGCRWGWVFWRSLCSSRHQIQREPLRRLQWGQLKVATHKVSRFSEPLRSKTLVFPLQLKTGGPLASLRDRG